MKARKPDWCSRTSSTKCSLLSMVLLVSLNCPELRGRDSSFRQILRYERLAQTVNPSLATLFLSQFFPEWPIFSVRHGNVASRSSRFRLQLFGEKRFHGSFPKDAKLSIIPCPPWSVPSTLVKGLRPRFFWVLKSFVFAKNARIWHIGCAFPRHSFVELVVKRTADGMFFRIPRKRLDS